MTEKRIDTDFYPAWMDEHPELFVKSVRQFLDEHPSEAWDCLLSKFAYRVRLSAIRKTAAIPAPSAATGEVVDAAREVIRTWREDVPMSEAGDAVDKLERALASAAQPQAPGAAE